MVISDQVGAVDNQNQRWHPHTSSGHGHLLQFVKGALDVQERSSVSRTSNAEQTANVAGRLSRQQGLRWMKTRNHLLFVKFKVQSFAQAYPENFQVTVCFKDSNSVSVDLAH